MLKLNTAASANEEASSARERRPLLIVDDEESIVLTLRKIFDPLYDVKTARSGAEALHLLSGGFRPCVILADQRMPGMTGVEFLAQSRSIVPEAVRVVLTGYSDANDIVESINKGKAFSFLSKPWNNDDLRESIRIAFEHYDLSEEKAALAAALQEVRALNAEKTEMMNIVSHDLKNPLGAVMGMSEIIINAEEFGLSAEDYRRFGREIHNASARMLALVKNLLDLNAAETGAIRLNLLPLNVFSILGMIAEEYRERATAKSIVVHCAGDETLMALADEIWFHQVLENLLSNAVKYSPHGSSVDARAERNGENARITVRDEGPGLNEDDQKRLFGKFARLSARPTGGEDSTGLGLSIVKKLVEAMNGKVWCESELGKGATFIVELPLA
jgi:signal transduction histidine kinase